MTASTKSPAPPVAQKARSTSAQRQSSSASGPVSRPTRSTSKNPPPKVRQQKSSRSAQPPGIRPRKATPAPKPKEPKSKDKPSPASTPSQPPTLTRAQGLQILAHRANAGSKNALKCLRQLLDECPEIWSEIGDLGHHAELAWLDLFAGGDHLVMEAAKRQVAHMKTQLKGPTPSALESLLADQICSSWLALQYSETASAQPGSVSLGESSFRLKRAESAQKRHLAALKALATVRALVPKG